MFVESQGLEILLRASVLSVIGVVWIAIVARIVGLRSFSKMTAVDFVTTLAVGSLLAGASQATDWPGFWQAVLAIPVLLGFQAVFARLRIRAPWVQEVAENQPAILMRDGRFLHRSMARHGVSESDLWAKLRQANVTDPATVRAVVLETTGDIAVLQGEALDPSLLSGVALTDR